MFDCVPKMPLLPVKKKTILYDFTQSYILLYNIIQFL